MKTILIILAGILVPLVLRAQVVNDGATNTLDNVTNTITGDVVVGTNGSFTLLVLTNSTLLTNSGRAVIGRNAGANSNTVLLASLGARWFGASQFIVGSNGSFNRLLINGLVRDNMGYLGFNPGSGSNLALVSGAGAAWSNTNELYVGYSGAGNQMVVSNGGLARNTSGYVSGGGSNVATITGSGSLWSNANDLFVGTFGSGNRLVVSEGGAVRNNYSFIGVDSSCSNNLAFATGPGSTWTNALDLYVGYSASGNQVAVSNGATVFAGTGFVGATGSGNRNSVLVTDAGSSLLLSSNLYVGSNGVLNRLTITNGAMARSLFAGIGAGVTSSNNVAVVTGAGSVWSNGTDMVVGDGGAGNQLIISNGGQVFTALGELCRKLSSRSNSVVITGLGSLWSNSGELLLGRLGAGNQMIVSNGGRVECNFGDVGANMPSSNNTALVTGAGSLWSVTTDLFVGAAAGSSGNRLVISNGATVRDGTGNICFGSGCSNNEALVTGPGSSWSNVDFFVGAFGTGNRLVVSNGAILQAASSISVGGPDFGADNRLTVEAATLRATNEAGTGLLAVRRGTNLFNSGLVDVDELVVTNAQGYFDFNGGRLITRAALITNMQPFIVGAAGTTPAVWDARAGASDQVLGGHLFLGNNSSFNQLLVTNGGFVTNGLDGLLGVNSGAKSNLALVAGAGSRWAISRFFEVGLNGGFNRLVISNGGWVGSVLAEIGSFAGSGNNQTLVSGAGSVWTNRGDVNIGTSGSGNGFAIGDAGLASSSNAIFGFTSASSNNLAVISDAGSRWLVLSNLYVGSNGSLNRLIVTNGALLRSGLSSIGHASLSSNNLAVVTDPGSVWSSANDLYVGLNGRGNQLVISNGGMVFNGLGEIGRSGPGGSNVAWVTGGGTVWSNANDLVIGRASSGNQLVISNGGLVVDVSGYFGTSSFTSNNTALVTDSGSVWKNTGNLLLGIDGGGARLVVSNGGFVQSRFGYMSFDAGSSNNQVVATGPGSIWTNGVEFYVGYVGGRDQLSVMNGGKVFAASAAYVGVSPSSTNNRIQVDGGSLIVTNVAGSGMLDIRRGTNALNSGLVEVDLLLATNALGFFELNGGTLRTGDTIYDNGLAFSAGNGVSAATLELRGGTHVFAKNLVINSNATLAGDATVLGAVTVQNGGTLAPGFSVGVLVLSNSPVLQGTVLMEVSKGSVLTNDQVQVGTTLTYGGALSVVSIGTNALATGDRFQLFSAPAYAGSFASIALPPLSAGLDWTNKLLLDGSIEVVTGRIPRFDIIRLLGTNLVFSGSQGTPDAPFVVLASTNVALPLTNWAVLASNKFDAGGSFSFTNAVLPVFPRLFFRLRSP